MYISLDTKNRKKPTGIATKIKYIKLKNNPKLDRHIMSSPPTLIMTKTSRKWAGGVANKFN